MFSLLEVMLMCTDVPKHTRLFVRALTPNARLPTHDLVNVESVEMVSSIGHHQVPRRQRPRERM